jgi:hypothetical protein
MHTQQTPPAHRFPVATEFPMPTIHPHTSAARSHACHAMWFAWVCVDCGPACCCGTTCMRCIVACRPAVGGSLTPPPPPNHYSKVLMTRIVLAWTAAAAATNTAQYHTPGGACRVSRRSHVRVCLAACIIPRQPRRIQNPSENQSRSKPLSSKGCQQKCCLPGRRLHTMSTALLGPTGAVSLIAPGSR